MPEARYPLKKIASDVKGIIEQLQRIRKVLVSQHDCLATGDITLALAALDSVKEKATSA